MIGLGRLSKKIFALTVVGAVLLVPIGAAAQTATRRATTVKKATTTRSAAARARANAAARARASAASRARSAAAARAAATARVAREADTPRFKTDLLGNLIPDVRAAAAIVFNPQTNEVLWEENSHDPRSIASLTKLMTAVTFIADEPDLDRQVTVVAADTRAASVTYLRAGEVVSLRDVLHLTLIASDNAAARILARTSEGGSVAFIRRMNEMGKQLGFTSAYFADPSGLDARNVASAYDISHLIAYASADAQLAPVMRKTSYEAHTNRRAVTVRSTNRLLVQGMDVVGGKTGFISKAGYCLATLLQVPQGSQVAVVVLGAANSTLRFAEVRHLFNWVVGRTAGLDGGEPGAELIER